MILSTKMYFIKLIGLFALMFFVFGCGGESHDNNPISDEENTLTSIIVTPENQSISSDSTQQFLAEGIYSNSEITDLTDSVEWTSSNTVVATISNSGLTTAIAEGSTTITATSGIISGSSLLTVISITPSTIASIALTPENSSIPLGTQQQFKAIKNYSDGTTQDISTGVTWGSSNESVAKISTTGLATALAAGITTITATSENTTGYTLLTVTTPDTPDDDFDNDGYPQSSDCDDNNPAIHPGTVWYKDYDSDGYSDGSTLVQCERQDQYFLASELTSINGDCDDNAAAIHPGTLWYKDFDSDGYSDGSTLVQCERPEHYFLASELTAISSDCDDNDETVNPGEEEVPFNGKDDDCNPDTPPVTSAMIIDHECTELDTIPEEWILQSKSNLHIAYGHTSHGSQLTTGMSGLVSFKGDLYAYNSGGTSGALDLRDTPFSGAYDLGNPDRTAWATATRNYLDAHSEVNVIIWSWCGQVSSASEDDINTYLNLMDQLEYDYSDVDFVYMTGHLDGTGLNGNLHQRNEQIRNFCRENNKTLYDFAAIETYDPDGTYFGDKIPNDGCYYDSDSNGDRDGNWAIEWQDTHTQGIDWYSCVSAHSQPLNANLKAYAAWWLWARLAGWDE